MVIYNLKSCRPMEAMSTPSMKMAPPTTSMIRNRPTISEDLPAPVQPTIPTWAEEKGSGGGRKEGREGGKERGREGEGRYISGIQ